MQSRPRDFLMDELRKAQKQLVMAKRRKSTENTTYLRARIAELRKEMEGAE